MDPTPLELAERLVERARASGADEADAVSMRSTDSTVEVRLQQLEKVVDATSRAVGLRVIVGGRQAVASTADISDEALDDTVAIALGLAKISEPDPHAGLPAVDELAGGAAALQLFDESLEDLSPADRRERALACEQAALDTDPKIGNSGGASFSTRTGEIALAASNGFAGSYTGTSASISVEVMAKEEDGRLRNDYWFSAERALHRLEDPQAVGREAAARALRQIGAAKGQTCEVPVVWEPRMSAGLLGIVAMAASGDAFYRRATFLAEREGEQVAAEAVSVIDDPTIPGRLGSKPFDGEGVATRENALIEDGVFRGFLFDTYNARRTGRRSTGSAVRDVGGLPGIGTGNLRFIPGQASPTTIIGEVQDGLYLTTLMGFGVNLTTGDFSRGAAGIWIRDGELAEPVTEINISGNLLEMLTSIDAVGSDVQWFGDTGAPTIRMPKLTISGS